MKIKFTDDSGEAFSNVEVTFLTGKREEIYITDTEGIIEFFEAKKGSKVSCFIHKDEKKEFVFDENESPVISLTAPLIDMIFVTIGKDEESITGAKVFFEYGDKKIEKISDNTGQIILEKVPLNTDVKVCQIFGDTEQNVEINRCRIDKAQYFIITQKFYEVSSMKFKLVDKAGLIIRNADLRFKVGDKEFETITDHFGNVIIDDIKIGQMVECKQMVFGKSLPWHKFKCEQSIDDYILHGEKPTIYAQNSEKYESQVRMRFRLLNSKMQPIPNAVLRLEYGINVRNKYTNQAGEAMVDDVLIGDKINAMVSLQGKKTEAEFICQKDDELHEIIFKTGAKTIYFILIPLVVIIGLIIVYSSSGSDIEPKKEVVEIVKKDTVIIKDYKFYIKATKSNLSIPNSKVKLVYADNEKEQVANDKGITQFAAIKNKLPVKYEISALGFKTLSKPFSLDSVFKISLIEDDSIEISNIQLPCNTVVQAKGTKVVYNTFKMNMPKGRFKIWYNLFNVPTKVEIYNGKTTQISDKSMIFSNKDFLTGISNPGMEFSSPDSLVTVKMWCKTGKPVWLYKIYCSRQNTVVVP